MSLARDAITSILDSSAPLRMQTDAPMAVSFDEAMNQEYVNVLLDEEGNPINGGAAAGDTMDRQDMMAEAIGGTPLCSPNHVTEDPWNN